MPANVDPIYSRLGDVEWGAVLTAANTAKDGTGTTSTVFTADATNGGFVQKLIVRPAGTNVATVVRTWVNNGATSATATNNSLIAETTIAATTLSEVAAVVGNEIPLNFALPAGYKILVACGTTVAGGLHITGVGGAY